MKAITNRNYLMILVRSKTLKGFKVKKSLKIKVVLIVLGWLAVFFGCLILINTIEL